MTTLDLFRVIRGAAARVSRGGAAGLPAIEHPRIAETSATPASSGLSISRSGKRIRSRTAIRHTASKLAAARSMSRNTAESDGRRDERVTLPAER